MIFNRSHYEDVLARISCSDAAKVPTSRSVSLCNPRGNVLGNAWGHIGSCLDVARLSRTKLAREPREWQSVCIAARSAHRRQKHVSGGFEIRRAFAWARAKSENSVTTRRDCRQRHATYLSLRWAKDEHIPDFPVNVVSPERADRLG